MQARQAQPGPLSGMTVVTLEHAIAAPFCTRQLADLGARVIKVERPGVGDFARAYDHRTRGLASHFVWTNRSKESLTLDLKQPAAQDVLGELVAQADVLVQNLAPGAAARMGLSFDALHARYPRLIVCDISGYGGDGPYRDKKAYDLLIQSEAAFLSITGTPDEPCKAGNSIADIAAGMYAYTGILSALLQRGVTGKGSHVEISMLEALAEWMGFPMYYAYDGQQPPGRKGAAHATIYPYGPFTAGDGRVVMLGLQNEREWKVFCDVVLRRPDLATDPRFDANVRRSENRASLKAVIEQVFADLTAQDVIARLDEAQIANAAVNQVGDLWTHPQLHARGRFRTVGSPAGELRALLPPATIDSFDVRMDPVPALGEHSTAILRELGRSDADIEQLRADGVI
ncbi:CaiB/BaiF CoA transferase family protein [Burkholderia multivorans]|uniref:CaiB/BaiF CoA transferase family protein n=1 Tax=Burkholderia multivorans TaxID=87883 RepID=UPI000D011A2A|nr:CaiB/BaiF CoA-transferase family protein [Burkholderia multivorans]MBR8243255.1 CoA transferase [Burkholderia multivorans]MDN7942507.1 CaiB/BaiF CoA-transferase family protein [Burkholderia multivorans]MDR9177772.1 Acetyl-CoA:oxalate CoA-transferase [Burkholderia multivorans]MDR9182516.1 Acetyl-CoA:oxalate CoA-transferase [Burkholderia multivorans]MDR9187867.1 Acetyl-CoA:oxalate CoA-transferase [Burkholderia multivorans]